MMRKHFYTLIAVCLLIVLAPYDHPYAQHTGPSVNLVAAGGGSLGDEIREQLLSLSPAENPNVLIIPQAAQEENWVSRGESQSEVFAESGVDETSVLALDDPDYARSQIAAADVIWMPGGSQQRLMRALERAGIADDVRERVLSGIPAGGTSAGAAIMSDVMIANSSRDEDTGALIPVMSYGLAFWPEVIVDQHFSERNRLERLVTAVQKNPELTGVGIDESTAVVVDGNGFRVIGTGTVTVVRASAGEDSEPDTIVLNAGDTYNLKN